MGPTPGSPLSAEPAIEEPAITKTKARMKLTVRIDFSPDFPVRRCPPVFVGRLITIPGFQNSAPKAENGFVDGRIVSSAHPGRNNWGLNPSDSNLLEVGQ